MCFCCCTTRKSILIYTIVISSFAFIYGIIAIANFGSSTEIYKALIAKLEELEKKQSRVLNLNDPYPYPYYGTNTNKYAQEILNSVSFANILNLNEETIKLKNYSIIKSLKGIECGLGVVLFIFPLLFLVAEIVFLIFARGIKEYQVLPNTIFNIFNIIRIVCISLSTLLIFLSILYGILLVVAVLQYIALVLIIDSCVIGMIIGMVFGYYGLWYYIVLSCAFCTERTKYLNVGSEGKPGAEAQYDVNGNPIPRNTTIIQQIVIPGQIGLDQQSQMHLNNQQSQLQLQPQTVEIKKDGQNMQLNNNLNKNNDAGGSSYRKLNDANDMNTGRTNNKK